jgi:hypothetical protein
MAEVKARASLVGGDVVIKVTDADWMTLDGVGRISQLKSNDFLFN